MRRSGVRALGRATRLRRYGRRRCHAELARLVASMIVMLRSGTSRSTALRTSCVNASVTGMPPIRADDQAVPRSAVLANTGPRPMQDRLRARAARCTRNAGVEQRAGLSTGRVVAGRRARSPACFAVCHTNRRIAGGSPRHATRPRLSTGNAARTSLRFACNLAARLGVDPASVGPRSLASTALRRYCSGPSAEWAACRSPRH